MKSNEIHWNLRFCVFCSSWVPAEATDLRFTLSWGKVGVFGLLCHVSMHISSHHVDTSFGLITSKVLCSDNDYCFVMLLLICRLRHWTTYDNQQREHNIIITYVYEYRLLLLVYSWCWIHEDPLCSFAVIAWRSDMCFGRRQCLCYVFCLTSFRCMH